MADGIDQEGLFQGIIDAFKTGIAGRQGKPLDNLANQAYAQASELVSAQEAMVGEFGRNNDTFKNMYHGVRDIQSNFYSMSTAGGQALSTIFDDQADLITNYQAIVGTNLLQIQTTQKEVTAREMADLTLYGKALNFGTAQTQRFLERQFSLTGEANDELLKQALAYSDAIEEATQISSKIIAENISGMMTDVKTFGNMTVEEMSEAAAAIAKVGLEVDDLGSLVMKFSTFESSAEIASKLTQVFGVQLDALKYTTTSFESPEDMLQMLQEDFALAGQTMDNMGMDQKRMLADTLGVEIDKLERLLGSGGTDLSEFAPQVSAATAAVGESEIEGALAAADNDIERINQMYGSAEIAARRTGERTARAISSIFTQQIASTGQNATRMAGQLITTAATMSDALENDLRPLITEMNDAINVGMGVVGDGAQSRTERGQAAVREGEGIHGTLDAISESGGYSERYRSDNTEVSTPAVVESPVEVFSEDARIEALNNGVVGGNIATVEAFRGGGEALSEAQIRALLREIKTDQGRLNTSDVTAFVEAFIAAQEESPDQSINITLVDTAEGFEARLDGAGVVRVTQ